MTLQFKASPGTLDHDTVDDIIQPHEHWETGEDAPESSTLICSVDGTEAVCDISSLQWAMELIGTDQHQTAEQLATFTDIILPEKVGAMTESVSVVNARVDDLESPTVFPGVEIAALIGMVAVGVAAFHHGKKLRPQSLIGRK